MWRSPVALVLTLGACGGAGGASPDAGRFLDAGTGDFHPDRVGVVNVIEGGVFLSVFAGVQDGPERPVPVASAVDGACAVYRRPAPALCEPACAGVCEAPGVCWPWPQTVDVGTITVTGLARPLAFVLGSFGYEPQPAPTPELFGPGDPITISAPGGAIGGFTVDLTGVADLVAPTQHLTLVDGQPAEVTWTAAASGRVQLALVVGWHGAPYEAMLVCETADDGALTIPGALIAALPRASSGLEAHASTLTRFERKSVVAPAGVIELVVGSQVPIYFSH